MKTRIVKGSITTITEKNHNMFVENSMLFSANGTIDEVGINSGVSYGEPEECEIISIEHIQIGKARRDPGYNFDGTKAEDMYYGDKPERSNSILLDPVFKLNDATLEKYLNQLMRSLSVGEMETVALEMAQHFSRGTGGTYKNEIINRKIASNNAFIEYNNTFIEELKTELEKVNFNPNQMPILSMNLLNFSSFWDKVSGLGITIHQVWSVKADLKNYKYNSCTKVWSCELLYTFYDHFGLDWDDIQKHGSDRIPQYHTGDFFKAWYILQHYRSAKPFITEFSKSVYIMIDTNNP